jgi:hypothetical protein
MRICYAFLFVTAVVDAFTAALRPVLENVSNSCSQPTLHSKIALLLDSSLFDGAFEFDAVQTWLSFGWAHFFSTA